MKHFKERNGMVIEANERCTYIRQDLRYTYSLCHIHVEVTEPVEIEDRDVDTLFLHQTT